MATILRQLYNEVKDLPLFPSLALDENKRFCLFQCRLISPKLLAIFAEVLMRYPSLKLVIEQGDERYKFIVYPKKEGTEYIFNYANKRLTRIRNRGNGILIYVVKDGLVEWLSETEVDDYSQILLTAKALECIKTLGTQELCNKLKRKR